jgi:hypothetical protein
MKIIDKKAIELFVVSSKTDYPFIRDELLKDLSKEVNFPFLINGFISLEERDLINIPKSTGAVLFYCDMNKIPLSVTKLVSAFQEKNVCPLIYSDEREASNLKKAIFEALPPFAMFIESLNLIKDVGPMPLSFKDFRDILLKDEKVLYSLFPYIKDLDKKKEFKLAHEYVQKFIETELENLSNTKSVVATHLSLIQYLKDSLAYILKSEEPDFNEKFFRQWILGYIDANPNQPLEDYLSLFNSYFEKELSPETKDFLKTLPNVVYVPKQEKKSISLDNFSLVFNTGVNLSIKEVKATNISLNANIQVDSIENGKLLNLSILS